MRSLRTPQAGILVTEKCGETIDLTPENCQPLTLLSDLSRGNPLYLLLGIYSRDNKGEVLEVGDKLLIYIHAGGDSPPGAQLCRQPEVSEASCYMDTSCWWKGGSA